MPLTHKVITTPGYDQRSEGYGQHAMEINFIVEGEAGALVFTVCTGWYPTALKERQIGLSGSFSEFPSAPYCLCSFHAHATLALAVDNEVREHCGWLDGPCVAHEPFGCTGKALGDLFLTLNREPMGEFWKQMETAYAEAARNA